ncbi:MAG: UDPGP type 1 family protein [Opitutales bacterium]|nr:UDPGP type 1 family protein [Opitutales bacterium]
MSSLQEMQQTFARYGQEHVFRFIGELPENEQAELLENCREIDLEEINKLIQTHLQKEEDASLSADDLEPAPSIRVPENGGDEEAWEKARADGEALLRGGKVACFTVAGGQGTRLGYDGPKGTYPVTPVSKKTLFQVFAEKIQAASQRYETRLPWFIMTSDLNHEETEKFFAENHFFGLDRNDVFFFRQGRMPAVDEKGKLLLAEKNALALSPDGHGGSFKALARNGALAEMEKRGIEILSYFQVDNPLVAVIDPAFIGFHQQTGSEMSSRMIPKRSPEEKVGNFCRKDGKIQVVEYSDMPEELAQKTDTGGNLVFTAGSIAIHLIDRDFANRMANSGDLPFHQAHKKVPYVDENGAKVEPSEPNAFKFEKFIFDALPLAQNPLILETRREEEFSPVKNATGVDSAESCRRDQVAQFLRWLSAVGVELPAATKEEDFSLEISPLFATNEREFRERWERLDPKPKIQNGLYIS